ncbi:DNA primase [Paenibacillus senegalensis]|uniref:DNA primase n=1 Tax=Paenibacillus senegalensis TaxID=1465766 RepID=UPI00028897AE|nr:DNA primase [Paenibacillus senegalensis]
MGRGRIPEEVIDAVLKHHDIADVVGQYVALTKQGQYLKGLCPFHSEKTPSFTVTPERQTYYCFGCHAGGNSIHFLMEIEGFSFVEAVRHMAEQAHIPITWEAEPTPEQSQRQTEIAQMIEVHELAAKWYHYVLLNTEQGKPALDYLRSRGLQDKWLDTFQIGYAPPMRDKLTQFLIKRQWSVPLLEKAGLISRHSDQEQGVDKFRDRILFPIHDARGRVIAFAGRALGDIQPKYLNSPETLLFNKGRQLFNLHRARPAIRKTNQAVLFEGYMDVIKAWEAGVQHGVAAMGTSVTEEHAQQLRGMAEEVIICYDGDSAGQAAAYKSIGLLEKAGLRVLVAKLPDRYDPDEFITAYGARKFVQEIVGQPLPAVRFRLLYIRRNFNLQAESDKLRYVETATRLISELNQPVEREHYIKELSDEFGYDLAAMRQQMNGFRQEHLKKRDSRDNSNYSWNNGIDNGRQETASSSSLMPAYQIAETKLLAAMILNRDIAEQVSVKLGDQFNIEAHAALAAYLYAYYSQGNPSNVSRFLASLEDEKLESLASSITIEETSEGFNQQVIDDYIREIKKIPQLQLIRNKKDEMMRAERSGDIVHAAHIASEIIALEKQLKNL